jgi:outer membrane biosynthesis protein TonB
MPLTDLAKNVIERPLPKEKIRQRPGKGGLTFDYVTPDFVIDLLNEAFEYRWSTSIFHQTMHGDTAVVGVNLTVWDAEGNPINKAQFGSCDVGRGMGPGEAFKGAASDAMKKAATLLGVAIELYQEEETPAAAASKFTKPVVPPRAPTPPSAPAAPVAPPTPPRPVASAPVAPPAPRPAPPAPVAAPQAAPARKPNPFATGNGTAAVPKPAAPAPAPVAAPPRPVSVAAAAPKTNPFASRTAGTGPNSTQLNALTNLSQKKGLSQPDMIALAGVVDELGNPKQSFEELSHAEAIQVIKASQL